MEQNYVRRPHFFGVVEAVGQITLTARKPGLLDLILFHDPRHKFIILPKLSFQQVPCGS
jgi:hypothetical protein